MKEIIMCFEDSKRHLQICPVRDTSILNEIKITVLRS